MRTSSSGVTVTLRGVYVAGQWIVKTVITGGALLRSIVVGTDENLVLDIEGASAGGNGRYAHDRNAIDHPTAYVGSIWREQVRGGRYATLTGIKLYDPVAPESVPVGAEVTAVNEAALYQACVAAIEVADAPPVLFGSNWGSLSSHFRRMYNDAHFPVLFQMLQGFVGLVQMPPELRGLFNRYLPARLIPVHFYLDESQEVVVVFGRELLRSTDVTPITRVRPLAVPVASGSWLSDSTSVVYRETVDGAANALSLGAHAQTGVRSLLARCRVRDLPFERRCPEQFSGISAVGPTERWSYIKSVCSISRTKNIV